MDIFLNGSKYPEARFGLVQLSSSTTTYGQIFGVYLPY